MKTELIATLVITAALGGSSIVEGRAEALHILGATLAGGSISAVWSFLKSRREHIDQTDTWLLAYMALSGSMALGFLLAPELAPIDVPMPYGSAVIEIHAPLLSFVFSAGGGPLIQKLASGWLLEQAEKLNPFNHTPKGE
jgi:hypothetical protein